MPALDKKRLRREIEKDRRAAVRARLLELDGLIKAARAARDEAIRAVRNDCALKRQELRESCRLRASRAKLQGNAEVESGKRTRREESRFESMIRAADKPGRLRSTRTTARERGQESDDEVRSNLPPELVPVFNSVRRHIKGTPRKSRTEAFLQYAEENPGEVFAGMQHRADRELAALLAEQERTERELRRAGGRRSRTRLADVPF